MRQRGDADRGAGEVRIGQLARDRLQVPAIDGAHRADLSLFVTARARESQAVATALVQRRHDLGAHVDEHQCVARIREQLPGETSPNIPGAKLHKLGHGR